MTECYVLTDRTAGRLRVRAALATALALGLLALGGGGSAQAATYNVNTFADELNTDGDCSLREAIRASNTNLAVDACPAGSATMDTINLQAGTYTISLPGAEQQALTGDLDVVGNFGSLTIAGNGATIDGGAIDRVFDMGGDLTISTLTISNLTVRNGNPGGNNGGGIRVGNGDTLNLTNVVVADNVSGLSGGGISSAGTVNLTDVTISGNQASNVGGGFNNSTATSSVLTANRSTISGNVAMGSGGAGLYNESSATATLTNVTISGNEATFGTAPGGGIQNRTGATLSLTNVTITGNSAGSASPGGGGGIRNNGTGTVNIKNTIVAGNTSSLGADCNGTMTSQGHNLDGGTTCAFGGAGDLSNSNPSLGLLANNGGPTQTHSLPAPARP